MTDEILSINDTLFEQCMGAYQWDLIAGEQDWSGGDLVGAANRWGARYAHSRERLLERIQSALQKRGWRAALGYVLMGDPPRWRVRLVLIDDSTLQRYDQVTGIRLDATELPSGLAGRRPGFERSEVA